LTNKFIQLLSAKWDSNSPQFVSVDSVDPTTPT